MTTSRPSSFEDETRQSFIRRFAHLLKTLPCYRHLAKNLGATELHNYFNLNEPHGHIRFAEEIMRNSFGFSGQHPIFEQLAALSTSPNNEINKGGIEVKCVFIDDEGVMHFSPEIKGYKCALDLLHNAESEVDFSSETDWLTDRSSRTSRMSPYNEKIRDHALKHYLTGRVIHPDAPLPSHVDTDWMPNVKAEWAILTNCHQWRLYRNTGSRHELVADVDLQDNSWPKASYWGELSDVMHRYVSEYSSRISNSENPKDTGDFYSRFLYFSVEWLFLSKEEKGKWLGRDLTLTPRAKDIFGWAGKGISDAAEFLKTVSEPGVTIARKTLPTYLEVISLYHSNQVQHKKGEGNLTAIISEMLRMSLSYSGSFPIFQGAIIPEEYHPLRSESGVIEFREICVHGDISRRWDFISLKVVVEDTCGSGKHLTGVGNAILKATRQPQWPGFRHMLDEIPEVLIRTNGLLWDVVWVNKIEPNSSITILSIRADLLSSTEDMKVFSERIYDTLSYTTIGFNQLHQIHKYLSYDIHENEIGIEKMPSEMRVDNISLIDIFKNYPNACTNSKLDESLERNEADVEQKIKSIISSEIAVRISHRED